jgi:Pyridoxamine 5'-phosphate oxidase
MVSSVRSVMKATNLDNTYGSPLLDWSGVEARLNKGVTQAPGTGGPDRDTGWLATINRDGSPHVTGIGGLWVDGAFWFQTGERTSKGRNLARDRRCTLSVATAEFDLVVEGRARKVTDPSRVAELAARWAAEGWPARVDDTGDALTADYSAPSAGTPTRHAYRLQPHTAIAVGTAEPFGATQGRF